MGGSAISALMDMTRVNDQADMSYSTFARRRQGMGEDVTNPRAIATVAKTPGNGVQLSSLRESTKGNGNSEGENP